MDSRKKLNIEEVRETSEFRCLTKKQQAFVVAYCVSGLDGYYDPILATKTAYWCKNDECARVMSYSLMGNIRIIEALNRHFNAEPIEDFIRQINRAIHNKKLNIAQVQALKLKADMLGYAARLPGTNNKATGTIPQDILDASKEARKAKRKPQERKPVPTVTMGDAGF